MPVNINGTTGIDTPGVASSGMPTSGGDPVVESGSNSDGGWVRWADGSQLVRKEFAMSNVDLSIQDIQSSINLLYPKPFSPFIPTVALGPSVNCHRVNLSWQSGTDSLTEITINLRVSITTAANAGIVATIIAAGYWK